MGADFPATDGDIHTSTIMKPPARAPKASARPRFARLLALLFPVLVCFVLPQQAAAQNSATDVVVSIDDASVGEGDGSVTLTARLSRAVNQDVLLGITYQDGTATVLNDLRRRPAPPRRVTILANTLSTNFSVLIRNDTSVEPVETLTVSLGGISLPPDTNFVFSGSRATLTIIDNDNPPPPVNNPVQIADPQPIPEGAGHLNFVVTTKFNVNSDVVLGVAYAGGTTNPATPADDLGSDRPSTVTIAEGERRTTLRVPIIDDNFIEGNETFTVALSLPADNPPGQTLHFDGGADTTTATGTIIDDADDTPVVNATVSIANASVAENDGNAEFTVSLTTAVDSAVTLAVAYAAGTATLADDLEASPPTTVMIDQNQTSATLLVPIADDEIVEGNEDFTVTISEGSTSLPDGVTIGTSNSATGTITDNDMAEVTLSTDTLTVAENGTFTYTVSLSNPADEAVTVRWTATDGSATVDDDLDEQTNTVTFNANDNTDQTFTIAVNDDDLDEDNETFTVTLEVDAEGGNPLPTGVTIGTDNTATGTITDNDDTPVVNATVSIANASAAENVSSGNAEFTVSLTAAVTNDVVLAVAYAAGVTNPATLTTDLGTLPDTVMIDQNQTTATLLVPITDDSIVEGDETFTVTISEGTTPLPEGVTIGTDNTATGTIEENDAAEVTLSTDTLTAAENGTFTYTVSLSNPADEAVTVRWTATDDSATVDDDLDEQTNTVTFNANDNTDQTFSIAVNDDDLDEDDETFTVTLAVDTQGGNPLPTGVTIGTNNSATGTITDNDDTPVVNATVSIGNASVAENEGNAEFTVSLTTAVTSDVTLAVAYAAGTATLATDLGTPQTTVTINANTTSATLLVPIANDNIVEGNETFTVTISEGTTPLPDGVTIGTADTGTGTITEDDTAEVTLSTTTPTAAENGTFTYTVSLSNPADEAVTVRWTTTDGTATVANDLQATTNTVTFAANDNTNQTFTIAVNDDDFDEDDETFTVTLAVDTQGNNPLPTGVEIGTNNSVTGTITDNDDTPAVNATVSIGNASVAENDGNAEFTVSLTTAVTSDVTLAVAYAAGTATLATDLGNRPTTVTIDQNQTSATLLVPIANDNIVEGNETFTVTISEGTTPLPDGVTIGTADTGTGTITEDDGAQVTLGPPTLTAAENGGTFTYTVSLSNPADEAVTVRWTASAEPGDTATVTDDLQAPRTGTVTFNANTNTAQEFTISPVDDNNDEDNETFTVTLEVDTQGNNPLPTGVTIGTSNSSTATITDDDDTPAVNATISIDDESVAENGVSVDFTVSLSRAVDSDLVLDVIYEGTGDSPVSLAGDLGPGRPTTVMIEEGDTSATITVPVNNDALVEGDETFVVILRERSANPLPDDVIFDDDRAIGTIVDNETGQVTLGPPTLTAAENGGTFTYTVTLSMAAEDAVTVRWTATAEAGDTATVANDLQETTGTVTFTAGSNLPAQTFTIRPVDDNEDEDNETFTVTLSADTEGNNPLPTDITIGTSNSSKATITDDDETPEDDAMVRIGDRTVGEAEGTATFTVTLSRGVTSPVVLAVTYDAGSAGVATDLGTPLLTTVMIAADTTEATLVVPIFDDDLVEGTETFTVTLSENRDTPLPEGVTIADGEATGTITDNDEAPPPPPANDAMVDIGDMTVGEAEGNASFTVTLSRAVSSPVVLAVTYADGSATATTDLGSPLSSSVIIASDTTEATLAVPIIDDDLVEGAETFTVTLSEGTIPLPDGVTIRNGTATGTITDDDEAPPGDDAMVTMDNVSVAENVSGGNARFTVALSRAVTSAVLLDIAYRAGTANLEADLGTLPATVMIPANSTSATFDVPIIDDTTVEENETFTVAITLNTAPTGVIIDDGEATGTITDDDQSQVTLSPATLEAVEDGAFTWTVSLSAPVDAPLNLTWTASAEAGDTATVAEDLQAPHTGTVTFAANNAGEATFSIQPVDDELPEDAETFTVTLRETTPLPNGVMINNGTATGTITDNDAVPVTALIEDTQAKEGEVLRFKVKLDRPTDEGFTLRWSTSDGTAMAGEDYMGVSDGTLVLAAGTATAELMISSVEDSRVEEDEQFAVVLSTDNLPPGVQVDDDTAVGTIENDDVISVLLEPRRTAAMSALRRHVSRFGRVTSSAANTRLSGQAHGDSFSTSENIGSGALATGVDFGGSQWSGWLNSAYAGFAGDSNGEQADLYTGIDYLSASGNLVWGVLLGAESARLDVGQARYESVYLQYGIYAGVRLSEDLVWDAAVSYGAATPEISLDEVYADYDAQRLSIRSELTGTYNLLASGALTVSPQLGILYAREHLGSFFDSVGGIGPREVLELGRISAGPRFIWRLPRESELIFGTRFQWDMLRDAEGRETRLSGAVDLGARFNLTPNTSMGIVLEADGIGNEDEFATYSGRVEIDSQF